MITAAEYLGKNIGDICSIGFASADDNHCAHFVYHALGNQFGFTCHNMKNGPGTPANIRVQDVFARCGSVEAWGSRPATLTTS